MFTPSLSSDCHPEPAKDPLLRACQQEADPSFLRMTVILCKGDLATSSGVRRNSVFPPLKRRCHPEPAKRAYGAAKDPLLRACQQEADPSFLRMTVIFCWDRYESAHTLLGLRRRPDLRWRQAGVRGMPSVTKR